MKRTKKLLMLLLSTIIIIWGCSSSTEPADKYGSENEEVVNLLSSGMWEVTDSTGVIDFTDIRVRFKFNTNHTVLIYVLMPDPGSEWEFVNLVTWRLEENSTKLIFPTEPNLAPAKIEKLSETELVLYFIEEGNRDYYTKIQE